MIYENMLAISPYSLGKSEKEKLLTDRLLTLTDLHKKNCPQYSRILKSINFDKNKIQSYTELPFLPVRLFKELSLKSVPDEDVVKIMTSSGTSGQKVSKIFLDRATSSNQQKTMVKIVSEFTGSSRMPMIIIDCHSVIKDRNMFSARGAGILGFSIFGSKKIYALDDDMKLDFAAMKEFLAANKDKKILLFGFTFMVWQHFYKELKKLKETSGETLDLSNAILIHGGGWKKLVNEAVSADEFGKCLHDVCGIEKIHDYYGMVEQTGCIYMQCEYGHLHSSIFSDVIIRRPRDFSQAKIGERGIIQVVSAIPESYPGHSLLTEDEGEILGEDDCPCGRKGKYFKIFGRLKNAEIRGCSDTYAQDFSRGANSVKVASDSDGTHGAEVSLPQQNAQNADDEILSEISNRISFLVGNASVIKFMKNIAAKNPFDESVVDFLNDVSKELMSSPEAKKFPDVVTLGFWLRKANINALKKRFYFYDENVHLGRGVAFHIAPSNVPVNYAYSLFTGLLCGNANIVRVPSKNFVQVSVINDTLKKVLEKHSEMKHYICLVRYEREKKINDYLSIICDVRVIWGGDASIAELRKSPLHSRASEITFADRFSLAVIDSEFYLRAENKNRIAQDFYNDTYLSDQNACTSPRVVVWSGAKKDDAKKIFWQELENLVQQKYEFQPIIGVDKISTAYVAAACKNVSSIEYKDNLLFRVKVGSVDSALMNYRGNCGYFYEYDCSDIAELKSLCDDVKCQTVGVIGNPDLLRPLVECGVKGIDRIVPVGRTMDFDLNWDGYNLVERLTRVISMV